jgi:hypothetical protein
MRTLIILLFLVSLSPIISGADELERFRSPDYNQLFQWFANHESGDFDEYFWRHSDYPCGWLRIAPDPTGSGRGYVAESQIICPNDKGEVHRLYPTLNLEKCRYGSYYSSFYVWLSAAPVEDRPWISLATYTNVKNWQDLFGVNLGTEEGQTVLVLFHVPKFGQGRFKRVARLAFPMKRWVKIEVLVSEHGFIRVFQDKTLLLQASKEWGAAGPAICEAHWGLYAHGEIDYAHLLNDDILLKSNGYLK